MDIRIINRGDAQEYVALVTFAHKYYGSATFPLRGAAEAWYETTLVKAIRGELLPVADRRAHEAALATQAAGEALLDRAMPEWADAYLERPTECPHGKNRNNEYKLVGALLKDKSLRAFQGRHGAILIHKLSQDWMHVRKTGAPGPLKRSTTRLRLTALLRLIDWAAGQLPAGVAFTPPEWDYVERFLGWALPAAHGDRRTREPADDELAQLLA